MSIIAALCTGNELLSGTTINTNLGFIGRSMTASGMNLAYAATVPDSEVAIRQALLRMFADAEIIITSGGLGSTGDDITRNVVCDLLRLPLQVNQEYAARLRRYWHDRGRLGEPPQELFAQAEMPESAVVLKNRYGSAPGLWLEGEYEGKKRYLILLPGPPMELEPMFITEVLPRLKTVCGTITHTGRFMVVGESEMVVEKNIVPLLAGTDITPAYCASREGVKVFLTGSNEEIVVDITRRAMAIFGHHVALDGALTLAEEVSARLRRGRHILTTAESCTGGMIATTITDLPGSSEIFAGAVVAYSNQVKMNLLGVPEDILIRHGAVSGQCVRAMVEGACLKFNADAGIAVSGIAGPGGGTTDKPVGLVCIAAKLGNDITIKEYNFRGDRDSVRRQTVIAALHQLRAMLLITAAG